jgi:hypothetical protein
MSRSIEKLVNIGSKMAAYLAEIGITQEAELREIGVMAAYRQLKERNPRIMNRMALYALYGALTDQNCLYLPEESKEWLEIQLKEMMGCEYRPPAKALQ